jgi:ribosomal protein S21
MGSSCFRIKKVKKMRRNNSYRKNKKTPIRGCVTVEADECHGDADRMVRKFIKKVKRDGIIDEFRDRTHYKKPSVVKRIKKAARQRLVDKVNRKREELFTATNKKRSGSKIRRRR